MERAGAAVADSVVRLLDGQRRNVLVLCGPGNNGGDGLVAARILSERGVEVTALVVSSDRYSADCAHQIQRCPVVAAIDPVPQSLRDTNPATRVLSSDTRESLFSSAGVIVDALLGTGQRSAPRGAVAALVSRVVDERNARSSLKVVAVDIPTGVDADSGAVSQPHVTADFTVAIELVKRGCLQFPARAACGALEAVSIGISTRAGAHYSAIEGATIPSIRRRAAEAHKGDLGRILVVGGSAAMPGAAVLAVLGALHSGAGRVSRILRPDWSGVLSPPECIQELLDGHSCCFTADDVGRVCSLAKQVDAVVLGPGIGLASDTVTFVVAILKELRGFGRRIVIDADALTIVAEQGISLEGLPAIITPHPGEAGRLLGKPVTVIQNDRFAAVSELAERFGCTVLLKGAGTIVCGEGQAGVVARGTPYLATAGSGDVLSGIIAACLVRTGSLFDAAALGAYLHAVAGEEASRASGGAVLASDVARAASGVMGALERR